MAKKPKIKNNFKSNYLLFVGIFLILIFVGYRYHQIRILSFSNIENINSEVVNLGFEPIYIKAYPVGIDIGIKPAVIVNGVWPVFPDKAGYVINGRNLIIYGHNKDSLFGPIRWIKGDANIEIIASDGKIYKYAVVKTDTVNPDNLEYIDAKVDETLTLYTCTGFLDSKRFIVVAKRIN